MHILIVILFITFFTDVIQLFEVGGYGVNLIDFAFLSIFIVFLKRLIWDGIELKFSVHPGLIFLIAIVFAALLSGLTPLFKGSTPQMIQYLKTTVHFLYLVFFTFICAFYKIETRTWTAFVKVWLILSIFINVFGIYQIFARAYDLPLAWLQFTNVSLTGRSSEDIESVKQLSLHYGSFFRATSIFTEPSALASFNILIQVFLIVPFVQKMKPFFKSKLLNIIIFVISLITLFLCFSMTGFVGMALIIGGIFIFHWSRRLIPFVAGFLGSIIILFATDSFIESYSGVSVISLFSKRLSGVFSETQSTAGESIGVRLKSAEVGIDIWERHFLIGSGLGLTAYNNREGVEFGDFSFVAALAEMGLTGLLAFVGIFISLFIITGRFLLRIKEKDDIPDDLKRWSGILFFMMLHLFLINFISGNNLVSFVLWLLVGVIFANIRQIYIETGKKTYLIKFLKKPLKISLNQSILRYLRLNTKK
ncbi:O-antigen ligase family protein [Bacteroidota bacterium]